MKPLVSALIALSLCLLLGWLFGLDFERGELQAFWLLGSLAVSAWIFDGVRRGWEWKDL